VIIKIPATIVAACINAETGVGPAIWQPGIMEFVLIFHKHQYKAKAAAEIQYILNL
jgi:hypothetical protein